MVTLKDVAKYANCSPATISIILNNQPLANNLSAETKRRVLKAIDELGYIPNAYAKSLRMGNIRTIGILCFDISDPFSTTILHSIEQYLNEKDYFYQLADVQNDLKLMRRFFNRVKGESIPSIIAMTNSLTFPPEKLAEMIGKELVFVSIGQALPALQTPAVTLDNAEGIRLGLEHLHQLGHRSIAFIPGPRQIHDAVVRREAIVKVCRELKLRIDERLMEEAADFPATAKSGALAIRRILARKIPFTAVFAFDDMTAYGVIQELYRQGRTVPRDISVIGFDDIWPSKDINPPLTTIQVPMVEMGKESARLVIALQGKKQGESTKSVKSRDVIFKPKLIVRESTAPPRTNY